MVKFDREDAGSIHQAIFDLLDHVTETDFIELERTISETSFLQKHSHSSEDQRRLALKLGETLIRVKGPSLANSLLSMEYFAASAQMATCQMEELLAHEKASHLFLEVCVASQSFEEQIEKAKTPENFKRVVERLIGLREGFCTSPEDRELLKTLYEKVRDGFKKAVPVLKQHAYSEFIDLLQLCIVPPLYVEPPTVRYKRALEKIRDPFRSLPQDAEAVRKFQREGMQAFREFFTLLGKDLEMLLGPPPCRYQVRGLGSFGREEPCPFSDLEPMIHLEEDWRNDTKIQKYFTEFTHLLDLQLRSLGETHTIPVAFPAVAHRVGLEIDSGNNPAICPGFIGSARQFADRQRRPFPFAPGVGLLTTSEHTTLTSTPLFPEEAPWHRDPVDGELHEYQCFLKRALRETENGIPRHQYKALTYLKSMLRSVPDLSDISYAAGVVDIKEKFLQPLYYALSHLALYYGIEETNTLDIVDALQRKGVFVETTANLLKDSVARIYSLRLEAHHNHQTKKDALRSKELEKIYWLMLHPLYRRLGQALSLENNLCTGQKNKLMTMAR